MKKYLLFNLHTLYHRTAESQRNLSVFGKDHRGMYAFEFIIHFLALFGFLELNEIDFSQLGIFTEHLFDSDIQFPFIG